VNLDMISTSGWWQGVL